MPRSTQLLLALVAVVVTACSNGTETAGSTSAEGAPRLSLEELRKNPCVGLTADQAAGLALSPGKSISDVGYGAGCMWTQPEYKSNVVFISFETFGGGGLDTVRANRADHVYHEEVEVEGYPGLFASDFDKRPEGTCGLYVGVTDGLVMNVSATVPEGPDAAHPCSAAKRIATTVAGNLRA